MRKTAFISTLFILSILLSGCIIVSSNKTHPPQQECPKPPQTNATIAEINAARGLHTDSARLEIYEAIAKRPNLSPEERIHLIEESKLNLHTDSARKQVLLILVNNHPPVVQPTPNQEVTGTLPPLAGPESDVAPNETVSEE